MRATVIALLTLALFACTLSRPMSSAPTRAEPPLRTLEPNAVVTRSSYDMEMARASVVPAGVSFRIDGAPVLRGRYVRLNGLLVNATAAAQKVVIFPAAPLGFYVAPASDQIGPKPPPPPGTRLPPPPVPPPPLVIELPPMTQVRIFSEFAPDDYVWLGPEPHELEWSFLFWNEPKPRGRLPVPIVPR